MTVKWYGRKVQKQLEAAGLDILDEVVTRIIEHARDNVRANDQIDTAHMFNSFYTVTLRGSTYSETSPPGEYFSRKQGRTVKRERAPEVPKPAGKNKALAANAAPYALWPELRDSFFYTAALMTDRDVPAIVKEIKRRHSLD